MPMQVEQKNYTIIYFSLQTINVTKIVYENADKRI